MLIATDDGREEKEDEGEDDDNHLTANKVVRSDQLWVLLLSLT